MSHHQGERPLSRQPVSAWLAPRWGPRRCAGRTCVGPLARQLLYTFLGCEAVVPTSGFPQPSGGGGRRPRDWPGRWTSWARPGFRCTEQVRSGCPVSAAVCASCRDEMPRTGAHVTETRFPTVLEAEKEGQAQGASVAQRCRPADGALL